MAGTMVSWVWRWAASGRLFRKAHARVLFDGDEDRDRLVVRGPREEQEQATEELHEAHAPPLRGGQRGHLGCAEPQQADGGAEDLIANASVRDRAQQRAAARRGAATRRRPKPEVLEG